MAAEDGYPNLVRLLLERGAGVNVRDGEGLTPLMWAAAAIDRGDTRIVEALLASGADPTATTDAKETAYILATRYGNTTAAKLLEKAVRASNR